MTNRLSPIFQSRDPSVVYIEITRLEILYRKFFRKNLPTDLLYFSSWGPTKLSEYGITLTWEDHQEKDAAWVRENVGKGEEAAT